MLLKMSMNTFFAVVVFTSLVGCTKDRLPEPIDQPAPSPDDTVVERHTLMINEFVARGSVNVNEYGNAEDWIEIFNPAFQAITLAAGRWYVSDGGLQEPNKYLLPELTLPARGFLVIWCDNLNTVDQQIHTNFALSSAGEHLVIFYDDGSETGIVVDDYAYGAQEPAISEGRNPDGGDVWQFYNEPTPGQSNQ